MLGYLDRFSVDLDFDLLEGVNNKLLRKEFYRVFEAAHLSVKDESKKVLEFFVNYDALAGERNTIKIDALGNSVASNQYKAQFLPEIDRMANCQTIETMFANKLVALTDRFKIHKTIAGRDIYDIHHFYIKGYSYHPTIITERTGMSVTDYLQFLTAFIEKHITQRVIDEDLNTLLPSDVFRHIRTHLTRETIMFIRDDVARWIKKETCHGY